MKISLLASLYRLRDIKKQPNPIKFAWDTLHAAPAGVELFNKLVSWMVPYTGTVQARVTELRQNYCYTTMKDRRQVRNHLGSIHAIAIANLAELCGNMAVIYSMPDDARFIVSEIHVIYLKKARGLLTAISESPVVSSNEKKIYAVNVEVKDASGDICATAHLKTLVGPK